MADLVRCHDVRVGRSASFVLSVPELRVPEGSVVGVVGENGAGKTTLLNLLPGFLAPDSGTVQVMGLDPARDPVEVRLQLGYMSDEMPLFDLRIGALLRMVSGYYPSWDRDLAGSLLTRFSLDPEKRVRELSKGEGTRVRLVLAMAFRPRLLVLDEPATGLDVAGRRMLMEEVLGVVRDPRRGVIISSHHLGDLERIADWLVVLRRGALLHQGPADEILGKGRTLEEALLSWSEVP